jgi:hypothetical protein
MVNFLPNAVRQQLLALQKMFGQIDKRNKTKSTFTKL